MSFHRQQEKQQGFLAKMNLTENKMKWIVKHDVRKEEKWNERATFPFFRNTMQGWGGGVKSTSDFASTWYWVAVLFCWLNSSSSSIEVERLKVGKCVFHLAAYFALV